MSEVLKEKGVENRIYHAGLSLSVRKAAHKAFVYDEVQVLHIMYMSLICLINIISHV